MRKRGACLAVAAISALAISGAALGASGVFEFDRSLFPYYPSLVRWERTSAPFTEPETCGGCHPEQYAQWMGSVHQLAFQDPIYQGELNKAFKAVGHEITRQCEGCHSPVGVITGEVKGPGISGLSPIALNGVSCDVCHSISGTSHTITPSREAENGSFVLKPGIDGKDGPVLQKRGPSPPSEGCGGGFHECVESPLHLRAELCAGCHQVYHYEAHFPLEATYLEWKHGPYAQRAILCQDCHMVELDTFRRSAEKFQKPARGEYRHFFNGANFLLYHLAAQAAKRAGDEELAVGLQQKYEMAVGRLKAAAELEIAPVYRGGALAEIRVRVKNVRAGHNLPTSLTNIRQMWIELTARDPRGRVLFANGVVAKDGTLSEDARLLNSEGMGDDFHFAVDPWIVTAFSRHDTVPPRGYRDLHYGISPPPGVRKVTVEAKLRYRQAPQALAEALLAAVPPDIDLAEIYGLEKVPVLPIVDMATVKADLNVRR
jgi:hypothetical protein